MLSGDRVYFTQGGNLSRQRKDTISYYKRSIGRMLFHEQIEIP